MTRRFDFLNRELSWLAFNRRVLQEAEDNNVPLIERMRFLGIFSNNMDEFFRVRVATLRRLIQSKVKIKESKDSLKPKRLLKEINAEVRQLQTRFEKCFRQIVRRLRKEGIYFIDENTLNKYHHEYVVSFFETKVKSLLVPIMLDESKTFPALRDKSIYFALRIVLNEDNNQSVKFALMEIPRNLDRFVQLPQFRNCDYVMLIDDVIRYNLKSVFKMFDIEQIEAFTIKLTRDAELDIDSDLSQPLIEKVSLSLKQRKRGQPVRMVYDMDMSHDLRDFLFKKLDIDYENDTVIKGGRYHNFKSFMSFPHFNRANLTYKSLPPLDHYSLQNTGAIMPYMAKNDFILHYPYQSFNYFIDLLREAAIDPKVTSIRITLYRVAHNSMVTNALINAAKNGKNVVVIIEVQARFDEENNIYWANKLQDEGVKVITGVPGYKVHSKTCLITRKENGQTVYYANIGTGNYNEKTAVLYGDKGLFTTNRRITTEVKQLFNYFEDNSRAYAYKHLMISPFNNRSGFLQLIDNEMKNAKKGKEAWILLKMNSLVDLTMIKKLYQASCSGVKIRLIIRGICCLIPGVKNMSENIEVLSIIDRFLEHARVYFFANAGNSTCYISSADWMARNLDHRIEASCPVYDENLKKELKDLLEMQWKDNVKARMQIKNEANIRNKIEENSFRSQYETYNYFKNKLTHK